MEDAVTAVFVSVTGAAALLPIVVLLVVAVAFAAAGAGTVVILTIDAVAAAALRLLADSAPSSDHAAPKTVDGSIDKRENGSHDNGRGSEV